MKEPILWPRPVSEPPQKEGVYLVKTPNGRFEVRWNKQFSFHEEFTDCSTITHWYQEIILPDDVIIAQ